MQIRKSVPKGRYAYYLIMRRLKELIDINDVLDLTKSKNHKLQEIERGRK